MKTIIMAFAILIAAGTTTSFAQTKKTIPKKQTSTMKYTCTMHPEVVKNKPGNCPKCGMKLVAKSKKPMTAPQNRYGHVIILSQFLITNYYFTQFKNLIT